MPIRLVIADDHEMYRKGFEVLLRKTPEVKIVGEADNGVRLLDAIKKHLPDVVITDIQMPVMDGVEACKAIKKAYPLLPVIALTTYNDDNLIIDMLEAGAEGYLLKNTDTEELVKAINVVLSGGTYFSPETNAKIRKMMSENRFNPSRQSEKVTFTDRENEIILLTCQGLSSKEIGAKINLSSRTVEGHKTRIQEKTGAKNAIEIVLYAIKHKMFNV